MAQTFRQGRWRGAIGLIAAYALVLQALAATVVATQAAARGGTLGSASAFAICTSHDVAKPDRSNAPMTPGAHCPICTLPAFAAATLPETTVLLPPPPAPRSASVLRHLVVASAYAVRPGSRGPPQAV